MEEKDFVEFLNSQRLDKESAEIYAESLKHIINKKGGENPTAEEYTTADDLLEEANMQDIEMLGLALKHSRDMIVTTPTHNRIMLDKNKMVFFNSDNTLLRELFNEAASNVTKKYGGFHQIGNNGGITSGWEMRDPTNTPINRIADEIYTEMTKIFKYYISKKENDRHTIDQFDLRKETVQEESIRNFMKDREIKEEDYDLIVELTHYSTSFIIEFAHNLFNGSRESSPREIEGYLKFANDRNKRFYEILLNFAKNYHWVVCYALIRFLERRDI